MRQRQHGQALIPGDAVIAWSEQRRSTRCCCATASRPWGRPWCRMCRSRWPAHPASTEGLGSGSDTSRPLRGPGLPARRMSSPRARRRRNAMTCRSAGSRSRVSSTFSSCTRSSRTPPPRPSRAGCTPPVSPAGSDRSARLPRAARHA